MGAGAFGFPSHLQLLLTRRPKHAPFLPRSAQSFFASDGTLCPFRRDKIRPITNAVSRVENTS
jgi:hypothetical protein